MVYMLLASFILTAIFCCLYLCYDVGRERSTASTIFGIAALILLVSGYVGREDYKELVALSKAQAETIKDYQEAERKLLDACELNLPRTQKCEIIAVPKEK